MSDLQDAIEFLERMYERLSLETTFAEKESHRLRLEGYGDAISDLKRLAA